MNRFALIAGGGVANIIVAAADYVAPVGETAVDITAATPQPAIGWSYDGSEFAPPAPPVMSLPQLQAQLIAAASAACLAISGQIIPDQTHKDAYTNAATIVWASAGKAPTADPAKSIFAAQSASVGISDADTFASVVSAVSLGSMQLSTILGTLEAAVLTAQSAASLGTALASFETSLAAFVASINTVGLTVAITAPAAIVINGVNA